MGKTPSDLQKRCWKMEDGAAEGNQRDPEDPAPMAHHPKNVQGDQYDHAD